MPSRHMESCVSRLFGSLLKAVEVDGIDEAVGYLQGGLFLYKYYTAFVQPIAFVKYADAHRTELGNYLFSFFFGRSKQCLITECDVDIAVLYYFNAYPV